ncbi:hypothetical protein B5M09_005324 [Aphanomyces astaci]|uniref:Uncharacterized protein n=1 Tax=Aphanomyces astaci TaxID=112090 RepID=A0A397E3D2_APHAT|nr:hypothetical protein DYB38_009079 [Aphanomyces astaci]RHZ40027.1 hypothetical protein DYB31_006767 [Aphanomyces astaci]RQM29684.1 hypothetical protein B5M09_005324 [Aphanomyces astaci]
MRALACKILALRMSLHHAMDHGRDKRPTKIALAHSATGISALSEESRGASHVLATDGDANVVTLAQHNIDTNTPPEATSTFSCHAAKHFWGEDVDALGAFDVVLGADIIACPYEAAYDALLLSLRHLLASPSTVALVAYKQRHGSEAKFFFKLKKEFDVAVVPKGDYHADFRGEGIDILRLSRKEQRNLS